MTTVTAKAPLDRKPHVAVFRTTFVTWDLPVPVKPNGIFYFYGYGMGGSNENPTSLRRDD